METRPTPPQPPLLHSTAELRQTAKKAFGWAVIVLTLLPLLSGCQSPATDAAVADSPFQFSQDTPVYRNELAWEYRQVEGTTKLKPQRRQPPPQYAQRCFAMVRLARQFHVYARFRPNLPPTAPETTHRRIQQVLRANGRCQQPPDQRISLPGYSSLHELSEAWEEELKKQTGGAWRSYFQRGNWRMLFPFSRRQQTKTVTQLEQSLSRNRPAIVHVVTFPALTINHAILIYDSEKNENGVTFVAYDPNDPAAPLKLEFNANDRTFHYPRTHYFAGGTVDVYEIYRNCCF